MAVKVAAGRETGSVQPQLLLVVPDPSDPTLWRYGRARDSGELRTYGLLRAIEDAIEQANDPGWPISNDAVTAMCLIRGAKCERHAISYDLSWKPISAIPATSSRVQS